jgi:uncharacterized protein
MELLPRWATLSVYALAALAMQLYVLRWAARRQFFTSVPWRKALLLWGGRGVALGIAAVPVVFSGRQEFHLPSSSGQWVVAGALLYGTVLFAMFLMAWTGEHKTDLARRRSVRTVLALTGTAPLAAAAAGIVVARSAPRLEEVEVRVPGLPAGLDGLRIAQITDLHYGPFFGAADLRRVVAMANEMRPHVTVVTGDLITRHGDNLRESLKLLSGLRADAGVYGCHGNHEVYARCERAATMIGSSYGIRYLRYEAADLRFGDAVLRVSGVDYQRQNSKYLSGRAAGLPRPGVYNLLLSHNPDVFPRAAELGFDLTLAGHTHGGQVTVEILSEHLNVARFVTPFTKGWYQQGRAGLYVSPGLGTVGAPIRLGAPPEVSLIRLCAV